MCMARHLIPGGRIQVTKQPAFVLLRHNRPTSDTIKARRLFIKSLGKEMVSEYMSTRMSTSGLHTYIQNAIHKYSSITPEAQPGPSRGNRGKCKYCAKCKTRYSCNFCKCRICLDHITACCTECVEQQTK
nr:unnamed protein product [Callosobruchus chinensis]CAH7767441.1 unnamed protein product [Callosobruchus chinensis]